VTSRRMPIGVVATLLAALLAAALAYVAQGRASGRQHATWGAVGDSITYGVGASDVAVTSYPARAGVVAHGVPGQCLVALGCAGEPLVQTFPSELAYLQRSDVTSVVVEIGINDLGHVTDAQYVEAYARLRAEAAAQGVRVVLSTMTPFAATHRVPAPVERQRERINAWIRHRHGAYVDYDAALRTGVRMRPAYASADGLHPDDAGYARMARALDRWIAQDVRVSAG
jgi:lysophospholipase L1-like esterase